VIDDFLLRALLAGIGVAAVTGPLGCFIIWRRAAYFGDTLSHSALLGVSLALLIEVDAMVGVFAVAVLVALALAALERRRLLPTDALLGVLSHAALALGMVAIGLMTWLRVDLLGTLFGDILSVSWRDLVIVYLGGGAVLAALAWIWRPLLAATVSADLAAVEAMAPERARLVFMILVAAVVAIAMKLVGVILITALLILPAAIARRFAGTPERLAVLAAAAGIIAVIAGLFGSLHLDTPSGPSIIVAAFLLFLMTLVPARISTPTDPARDQTG
jgi:zinc transport system permease protein